MAWFNGNLLLLKFCSFILSSRGGATLRVIGELISLKNR